MRAERHRLPVARVSARTTMKSLGHVTVTVTEHQATEATEHSMSGCMIGAMPGPGL